AFAGAARGGAGLPARAQRRLLGLPADEGAVPAAHGATAASGPEGSAVLARTGLRVSAAQVQGGGHAPPAPPRHHRPRRGGTGGIGRCGVTTGPIARWRSTRRLTSPRSARP